MSRSKPMRYLQVKNWKEHQHYTDRKPPWIKIYTALLDPVEEPKYAALPDAAKLLLHHVWLLAGMTDNNIPEKWINADRLNLHSFSRQMLAALLAQEFVSWSEPDSKPDSKTGVLTSVLSTSVTLVSQLQEIGIAIPRGKVSVVEGWAGKYGTAEQIVATARQLKEQILLADRPLQYLGGILRNQANGTRRNDPRGAVATPATPGPTAKDFGHETIDEFQARLRAEGKLPPLPDAAN